MLHIADIFHFQLITAYVHTRCLFHLRVLAWAGAGAICPCPYLYHRAHHRARYEAVATWTSSLSPFAHAAATNHCAWRREGATAVAQAGTDGGPDPRHDIREPEMRARVRTHAHCHAAEAAASERAATRRLRGCPCPCPGHRRARSCGAAGSGSARAHAPFRGGAEAEASGRRRAAGCAEAVGASARGGEVGVNGSASASRPSCRGRHGAAEVSASGGVCCGCRLTSPWSLSPCQSCRSPTSRCRRTMTTRLRASRDVAP